MLTNEQQNMIEQWCVDLENTTQKQGKYAMRELVEEELQYCCLGIMCETAGEEWCKENEADMCFRLKGEMKEYSGLPSPKVGKKFGLENDFNIFTNLNDDQNYTFKQIAAYVRKNYLNKEEVA